MTPQPQQEHVRWFGRSEDDPNRLLIIEDDHCRVFLDAELREELYAVIRSRPAPAPQRTESEIRGEILRLVESDEWQQEHDAAIAAQARVARDAEWATALNTLISTESVRFSPAMVDVVYSYRIAQIIQALREARR